MEIALVGRRYTVKDVVENSQSLAEIPNSVGRQVGR